MSDPGQTSPADAAAPLIELLVGALEQGERQPINLGHGRWQTRPSSYLPLLEDLLGRARRATRADEIAFLTRQAEQVLQLRAEDLADLPEQQEPGVFGSLVASLPLEPLRPVCARLEQYLDLAECQADLAHLLGRADPPPRVSSREVLLRSLGQVLLRGWGAREILVAPVAGRCRPRWDLFAPDLGLIVVARPQPRPLLGPAPVAHQLTLGLPNHDVPLEVEARLRSGMAVGQENSWTGLRWEEEQRLRAAPLELPQRNPLAAAARGLRRTLSRLERGLTELLAQNPPSAPWTWRRARTRRPTIAPM